MKKTIYLSLLAGCLITLGACEGSEYDPNQIPEKFHKILYLDVTGKQELTLYNTDNDNIYSFSIVKAGSDPELTANVGINVLTQEEVDNKYSNLEGVNYKVIAPTAYSFDATQLGFSVADRYKMVNISLKPREVMAAMEADPSAIWVLPFRVVSEADSINANRNELFLQLKEVITPSIGFTNSYVNVKAYTYGLVSTISESIPFKLDTDNQWDIECQLSLDEEYITAYNGANKTIFKALPQSTYSLPGSMTLPSGTTESKLPITVQGDQLEPGDYMLPIRITSVSQFEISSSNGVYPMAIRIMGKQLDRKGWTAEANTEELNGEGAINGRVGCLLDDDTSTFWHSEWQNNHHDLPHELIFDTQKEYTFTQFAIMHRENFAYVRAGEFYVSSDKQNWEKVGDFLMKQENGSQVFGINPTKGRYFKILITESNSGTNSALAEVYAYGLE